MIVLYLLVVLSRVQLLCTASSGCSSCCCCCSWRGEVEAETTVTDDDDVDWTWYKKINRNCGKKSVYKISDTNTMILVRTGRRLRHRLLLPLLLLLLLLLLQRHVRTKIGWNLHTMQSATCIRYRIADRFERSRISSRRCEQIWGVPAAVGCRGGGGK